MVLNVIKRPVKSIVTHKRGVLSSSCAAAPIGFQSSYLSRDCVCEGCRTSTTS